MGNSLILFICGVVCLAISGLMLHKMIPRKDRQPPAWMASDSGETAIALGQFALMIAGVALLLKAFS